MKRIFELDGPTEEKRSGKCFLYFSNLANDLLSFPYYAREQMKTDYPDYPEIVDQLKQRFVEEVGGLISHIKSQDPPIDSRTQKILEGCYRTWTKADWKTEKIEKIHSQMKSLSNYFSRICSDVLPDDTMQRRLKIAEGRFLDMQREGLEPHVPEHEKYKQ